MRVRGCTCCSLLHTPHERCPAAADGSDINSAAAGMGGGELGKGERIDFGLCGMQPVIAEAAGEGSSVKRQDAQRSTVRGGKM
jgi:hypothetical protein